MLSNTRFRNRKDKDKMVAAAGFMLKQENMKAKPRITLALIVRNRCEKRYSLKPSDAPRTLKTVPGA